MRFRLRLATAEEREDPGIAKIPGQSDARTGVLFNFQPHVLEFSQLGDEWHLIRSEAKPTPPPEPVIPEMVVKRRVAYSLGELCRASTIDHPANRVYVCVWELVDGYVIVGKYVANGGDCSPQLAAQAAQGAAADAHRQFTAYQLGKMRAQWPKPGTRLSDNWKSS